VLGAFNTFAPNPALASFLKTILRVLAYLRRYPFMASAQLACAIVGTLMLGVYPLVTRELINVIIPGHQWERLNGACLLATGAYLVQLLMSSLRLRLNNTFEQKVVYDLRSDLYERLQRLPLRWFDNRPTGDIMTTVSEDIPAVERVLIDGVEQGVIAVLQIGPPCCPSLCWRWARSFTPRAPASAIVRCARPAAG
jgi:ATP-binding cassette subfamily B protein